MRPGFDPVESCQRLLALLVATAVLCLAGWVMWQQPAAQPVVAAPAPALRWLLVEPLPPAPVAVPPTPVTAAGPAPVARGAAPVWPVAPAADVAAPAPVAGLFDADGRPRLAGGHTGVDGRSTAERVFEQVPDALADRRDAHLFDRPRAGTRQSRTQRAIYGQDIQAAQARPSPTVAFNPARHERAGDLAAAGSAQAYLSAAISDRPPPGPGGAASAELLPQQAALQGLSGCTLPAMRAAWSALEAHLRQLQQAEYRYGHGSSPTEREHSLGNEIARQYNLARRALWQVEQLRGQCPR